MNKRGNREQDEADALLSNWGANYELLEYGFYPSQNHVCAANEGGRGSGHSDPVFNKVKRRGYLMQIHEAVMALPEQPRHRLMEEYVERKAASDCGGERGVRIERDAARLAFWSVYQDRRRRAEEDTTDCGPVREDSHDVAIRG